MANNFPVPSGCEIITGPFSVCINNINMGLTSTSYTFDQNSTYEEVRGGQSLSVVRKYRTQTDYTLTIGFMEVSLDKLRLFYGETTNVNGTTLCLTSSSGCSFPEEVSVLICGPGPNCGCRNLYFPRAVVTPSTVSYSAGVDTSVEVEIEFTILPTVDGVFMCFSDSCNEYATAVVEEGELTIQTEDVEGGCQSGPFPDYVDPGCE